MKIIFAQGNPEARFDHTRHNVGFAIIDQFATEQKAEWIEKAKFHALVAELTIDDEKALLVKPTTFYNDTGLSARALIDFYKLDPATDLLVVHDDLALPFGTIRTRQRGGDAGNNGIKSLNSHIGEEYSRIRVGVWNELRDQMDDASFVLGKFNKEEQTALNETIIPHVSGLIHDFIAHSLDITSHQAI